MYLTVNLHSSIQRMHSQLSRTRIQMESKYLPQLQIYSSTRPFEFSLTFKNYCRKLLGYSVYFLLSSWGTSFPSPLNHWNNSIFARLSCGSSLKISVTPTTFTSCPRILLTVGQPQYCSSSVCLLCYKASSKAYVLPGSGLRTAEGQSEKELLMVLGISVYHFCYFISQSKSHSHRCQ